MPSMTRAPRLRDLRSPTLLLALGFGTGLLPKAPGTWGSLVGVALFAAVATLGWAVALLVTLGVSALGVVLCGRAARALGEHDHAAIVWDEIAGVMVALLFVPVTWYWLLAGFVAFRLFDITKPGPIGRLDQQVGGGLGIMLDDLAAGLLAGAVLWTAKVVAGL